jgi:hypothetical protein
MELLAWSGRVFTHSSVRRSPFTVHRSPFKPFTGCRKVAFLFQRGRANRKGWLTMRSAFADKGSSSKDYASGGGRAKKEASN